MMLIAVTIGFFAIVALLVYVGTELVPKWLFLRRHRVHKNSLEQFDITTDDDRRKPD